MKNISYCTKKLKKLKKLKKNQKIKKKILVRNGILPVLEFQLGYTVKYDMRPPDFPW